MPPPVRSVNVVIPAIVGGAGITVNRTGAELPPPGGGFWTTRFTRFTIPVFSKREAGMTAVIVVELTEVVDKTVCPTRTRVPVTKLEPTMVTVTGPDPLRALSGSIRSTVGAGF